MVTVQEYQQSLEQRRQAIAQSQQQVQQAKASPFQVAKSVLYKLTGIEGRQKVREAQSQQQQAYSNVQQQLAAQEAEQRRLEAEFQPFKEAARAQEDYQYGYQRGLEGAPVALTSREMQQGYRQGRAGGIAYQERKQSITDLRKMAAEMNVPFDERNMNTTVTAINQKIAEINSQAHFDLMKSGFTKVQFDKSGNIVSVKTPTGETLQGSDLSGQINTYLQQQANAWNEKAFGKQPLPNSMTADTTITPYTPPKNWMTDTAIGTAYLGAKKLVEGVADLASQPFSSMPEKISVKTTPKPSMTTPDAFWQTGYTFYGQPAITSVPQTQVRETIMTEGPVEFKIWGPSPREQVKPILESISNIAAYSVPYAGTALLAADVGTTAKFVLTEKELPKATVLPKEKWMSGIDYGFYAKSIAERNKSIAEYNKQLYRSKIIGTIGVGLGTFGLAAKATQFLRTPMYQPASMPNKPVLYKLRPKEYKVFMPKTGDVFRLSGKLPRQYDVIKLKSYGTSGRVITNRATLPFAVKPSTPWYITGTRFKQVTSKPGQIYRYKGLELYKGRPPSQWTGYKAREWMGVTAKPVIGKSYYKVGGTAKTEYPSVYFKGRTRWEALTGKKPYLMRQAKGKLVYQDVIGKAGRKGQVLFSKTYKPKEFYPFAKKLVMEKVVTKRVATKREPILTDIRGKFPAWAKEKIPVKTTRVGAIGQAKILAVKTGKKVFIPTTEKALSKVFFVEKVRPGVKTTVFKPNELIAFEKARPEAKYLYARAFGAKPSPVYQSIIRPEVFKFKVASRTSQATFPKAGGKVFAGRGKLVMLPGTPYQPPIVEFKPIPASARFFTGGFAATSIPKPTVSLETAGRLIPRLPPVLGQVRIGIPKAVIKPLAISVSPQKPLSRLSPISVGKFNLIPRISPLVSQSFITGERTAQRTSAVSITTQVPAQRQIVVPVVPVVTPRTPRRRLPQDNWIPRFEPEPSKVSRKRRQYFKPSVGRAYIPMLKVKGKYTPIGPAVSKGRAIWIGERAARKTAAASFKVIPTRKVVKSEPLYNPNPYYFRSYKISKGKQVKLTDEFIQRRSKRISSFGEVGEISKKGGAYWKGRKRKKKTGGRQRWL